ncbi:MAG: exodeoxyribonuclease VII small subunit [Pseudomonadota bacterium]
MAKQTFESAMKQLEKIVDTLEDDTVSLDSALKKFEEGMKLVRYCSDQLDAMEKKVALLTETPDGGVAELPFTPIEGE